MLCYYNPELCVFTMRVKVTLYIQGKVIEEYVEARDYEDAKQTVLRRNSKSAVVMGVTAVF